MMYRPLKYAFYKMQLKDLTCSEVQTATAEEAYKVHTLVFVVTSISHKTKHHKVSKSD